MNARSRVRFAALACAGSGLALLIFVGARVGVQHPPDSQPAGSPDLRDQWWQGNKLFGSGRISEAAGVFTHGAEAARARGDQYMAVRFLNSLGLCHYTTQQYRDAMKVYLEGDRIARATADWKMIAAISSNVSLVYSHFRDLDAAREAVERALEVLKGREPPEYHARLLLRAASVRVLQDDLEGAIPLFARGLDEADRQGDDATLATGWNWLGWAYLEKGRLDEAERALLEGFRLRLLQNLPGLYLSCRNLGILRREQGDYRSAARLLDEALAGASKSGSLVPVWTIRTERGRLKLKQGLTREALADFRAALDMARAWRLEVLPAESVLVSLDAGIPLNELYDGLLRAASAVYFRSPRSDLAREAFEAAEEHRAASLRLSLEAAEDEAPALPAEYGATLARLRSATVALMRRDTRQGRRLVEQLRHRLNEIEISAGLNSPSNPFRWDARDAHLLEHTQTKLGPDEVFLGFHLGETESYLWAVVRGGFQLHRLPGRKRITAEVERFAAAVREGSAEATQLGRRLYSSLFGPLAPEAREKPVWVLGLDQGLFRAPLAALVAGEREGRPVYLIERHSVRMIPSAHLLASAATAGNGVFVGIGDAIHNAADPRLRRDAPASVRAESFELARLPGSGREIESCARSWNPAGQPVLLAGGGANTHALKRALAQRPSVLHVATHFLVSRDPARRRLIALSLQPDGQPELIGSNTIRSWRLGADVVVLSGCSSGRAEVLPGAGLLGLTRAWLSAGSGSVVASRWPTPDDTGGLLLAFYSHLRSAGRPDVALRRAQQQMLRSEGWRSAPRYWGAYFVVGRW